MNKLAQGITNPILPEAIREKNSESYFAEFFPVVIGLIFVAGVIIFFFMVIFGAIQWIMSGGDKAALEQARGRITNAIVGIIVLFVSFAIIKVIETVFGIDILTLDIGPLKIQ